MNKPAITVPFEESGTTERSDNIPSPETQRFDQLWGTFRIVSSAPTWTPRGRLEESIALYSSGGTRRLYVFDYQAGSWHYASLT